MIYRERDDKTLERLREKQIGNTFYTVIARERTTAKETAVTITEKLIGSRADSVTDDEFDTDSLEGCNSGG